MSGTYIIGEKQSVEPGTFEELYLESLGRLTIDYLEGEGPPIDNDLYVVKKVSKYPHDTNVGIVSPFTTDNTDGSEYLLPFELIYTKTLTRKIIESGQISMLKQVHTLGDITYGDNEFGIRDGQDAVVYMPLGSDDTAEPVFTDVSSDSNGHTFATSVQHSQNEINGLKDKFGGLPSGQTASTVINEAVSALTNDVYQSLISREIIPNVIINDTKEITLDNLGDEQAQTLSVATTSTSVTTY